METKPSILTSRYQLLLQSKIKTFFYDIISLNIFCDTYCIFNFHSSLTDEIEKIDLSQKDFHKNNLFLIHYKTGI